MWRFLQKNVQKDKEEKLTCKVKVTKDVMAGMLRDTKKSFLLLLPARANDMFCWSFFVYMC